MIEYIALTCPSCKAKLQITSDIEHFACAHCGNEYTVKRSGGVVSLAPVVEGLQKVQSGVDRTASELAIPRLEKELTQEMDILYTVVAEGLKHVRGIEDSPLGGLTLMFKQVVRAKGAYNHLFFHALCFFHESKGRKFERDNRHALLENSSVEDLMAAIEYAKNHFPQSELQDIEEYGNKIIEQRKVVRKIENELRRHKEIVRI